ncbi:MAG: hypothetical protein HGA45_20615, partial [Chloroflexales bacterium]|nr:hypothetical protein [Chloroflexales bacterium]
DEEVVGAFRERRPTDEALVAALAWASLTAARRVGTWLALQAVPEAVGAAGPAGAASPAIP